MRSYAALSSLVAVSAECVGPMRRFMSALTFWNLRADPLFAEDREGLIAGCFSYCIHAFFLERLGSALGYVFKGVQGVWKPTTLRKKLPGQCGF